MISSEFMKVASERLAEDSLAKLAYAESLYQEAIDAENYLLAKIAGETGLTPEQVSRAKAVKKEGIGYASAATGGGLGEAVGALTGGVIGKRWGAAGAAIGTGIGTGLGQSVGSFTGAILSPKIDRYVSNRAQRKLQQ